MSMHQWESVGSGHHRLVVVNASIEGDMINSSCKTGGIVHAPSYACPSIESSLDSSGEIPGSQPGRLSLKIDELFCGGFSGWSHGACALNQI